MAEYGFGIIGCGMIAEFHAAAIRNIAEAKLVAMADVVGPSAKRAGERHRVDWYTDHNELLKRDDVDIVCICTPSGLHRVAAVDCANAGKHVVVEKPLETTLAKCDAIIEAADKAGVKLCGIFPSRFHQCNQLLKRAIDAGRFGRLTLGDVYSKWWRSQAYYDSGGWRGTWRLDGGGALMNQGIHAVDLLLSMMGPVKSVQAFTDTLCHERIEVEDTAVACLRFENGALGVVEGTTSVYPGMLKRMEIHGDKGTVVTTEENILTWEFAEEVPDDEWIRSDFATRGRTGGGASDPKAISHEGHLHQLKDMIQAIEQDRPPLVDGPEARKAVELILAIYQSALEHRLVRLPLEKDPDFVAQNVQ